jgi:Tfp pilus assembly protein FimT
MRKEKGFSMLETLIVSGVVLVASAAAVPSIVKASKQYQLNSTAQQINQALQTAKFDAIRTNSSKTVKFNSSTNKLTLCNGTEVQLPSGVTFSNLPSDMDAPQSVMTATANGVAGTTSNKAWGSFPAGTSSSIVVATFNSRGIPNVTPGTYNWINLKNSEGKRVMVTLSSAGSTRTLTRTSDAKWKGAADGGSIDDTHVETCNSGTGS